MAWNPSDKQVEAAVVSHYGAAWRQWFPDEMDAMRSAIVASVGAEVEALRARVRPLEGATLDLVEVALARRART